MLADLIVRLEKAEGPDRDLDIDIAKACLPEHHSGRWGRINTPEFTRSIDAALTLVPEGWAVNNMFQRQDDRWRCALYKKSGGAPKDSHVTAEWTPTPAIALCIPALKAQEAQQ